MKPVAITFVALALFAGTQWWQQRADDKIDEPLRGFERTALEAVDRAQQCVHSDWGRTTDDLRDLDGYLPDDVAARLRARGTMLTLDPTGSGHGYIARLWIREDSIEARTGRDPDGVWLKMGFEEPVVRGCERLKRSLAASPAPDA